RDRSRVLPRVGSRDRVVGQFELSERTAAPAIVAVVERVRRDDELQIGRVVKYAAETERIFFFRRFGLRERAGLIFEQREQQPWAYAVIDRDVIHHLRAGAAFAARVGLIVSQPSVCGGDERAGVESDLRGS